MKKIISRREKVLRTALQLVASGGFQGAPIAELAAKSKVAVGTIYHHFSNKEEMVAAMYVLCKENLSEALAPALEDKASGNKKFEKVWALFMEFASKSSMEFSFLDQYKSSPLITAAISKSAEKYDAGVLKYFADGIKSKEFAKADAAQLAEFFYANAFNAARVLARGKKKSSTKDVEIYRDLTWSGLKK
jgi:AcrR family transcriptional regulator